jgi:hypothetical protein
MDYMVVAISKDSQPDAIISVFKKNGIDITYNEQKSLESQKEGLDKIINENKDKVIKNIFFNDESYYIQKVLSDHLNDNMHAGETLHRSVAVSQLIRVELGLRYVKDEMMPSNIGIPISEDAKKSLTNFSKFYEKFDKSFLFKNREKIKSYLEKNGLSKWVEFVNKIDKESKVYNAKLKEQKIYSDNVEKSNLSNEEKNKVKEVIAKKSENY